MNQYHTFLETKTQLGDMAGFDPVILPDFLFPFQRSLVEWATRKGRGALFADCGLGKTPMQLVWAENVVRHTERPVLILTPLAVGAQTVKEGEKFQIECRRSPKGKALYPVTVANYERLHYFDASEFGGVVCDESSILKSFDGIRKAQITEFLRRVPCRLLCTATAAPNDYIELGTSSEALGELGYMDMLTRFFVNDQRTASPSRLWDGAKWRFKGHSEQAFWQWVCSWARSIRQPSDLGDDDGAFVLPPLEVRETVVKARQPRQGMLFDITAIGWREEKEVRRRTINERCEAAAAKVAGTDQPAVIWCHLNAEADALVRLIPGARQVSGADSDDAKEATFEAFRVGELRVLVTKPKIGAWGLNWQHCAHVVYFVSHSYEQYYQAVRRCWRYGQDKPVVVDLIRTDAEERIAENLARKAEAADRMFTDLVSYMGESLHIDSGNGFHKAVEVPGWM